MKTTHVFCLAISLVLLHTNAVLAETKYITNELEIGLHEEKNLDSPIIKTLPSGTALELVKREDNVSFVRDSKGANGWIDNSYLTSSDPTGGQLGSSQKKIASLENQLDIAQKKIAGLQKKAPDSAELANLKQEKAEVEAQLKSEKLKAGQLEAEISKLRKRVGQNNDNQSLYEQIEELESDKKNLEVALAISQGDSEGELSSRFGSSGPGWRNMLIYLVVAMLIGLGLGIYFMDFLNRRRHGGFRV